MIKSVYESSSLVVWEMSAYGMSPSEIVEALVRRGVPRAEAERQHGKRKQEPTIKQPQRETVTLPLTITLPWSCLVSDNRRYSATIRSGKPLLVLSADYSAAKQRIRSNVRFKIGDKGPTTDLVELHAAVTLPDHRRHDISNFAKIVHDSFEGIVYANDHQITKLTWEKIGTDVDSPRAVVVVSHVR